MCATHVYWMSSHHDWRSGYDLLWASFDGSPLAYFRNLFCCALCCELSVLLLPDTALTRGNFFCSAMTEHRKQ